MILRFLASFGVGFTTGRVTLADEVLVVFGAGLADFVAALLIVLADLAAFLAAVFAAVRAALASARD